MDVKYPKKDTRNDSKVKMNLKGRKTNLKKKMKRKICRRARA